MVKVAYWLGIGADALLAVVLLFSHILNENSKRTHKGMPLVWLSDCFSRIGFPVHSKRYLMLSLCEDAIRDKGNVSPETTGIYFRLVWLSGFPDLELKKYAKTIYKLSIQHPIETLYPEWILQELEQNWMTEIPASKEAHSNFLISLVYIKQRGWAHPPGSRRIFCLYTSQKSKMLYKPY